jgi:hypothetical protein
MQNAAAETSVFINNKEKFTVYFLNMILNLTESCIYLYCAYAHEK